MAGLTLLHQTTRPMLWADWFEQEGVPAPQALRGPRFEQFAMIAQAAISGLLKHSRRILMKWPG